jgi:hypothetical protein
MSLKDTNIDRHGLDLEHGTTLKVGPQNIHSLLKINDHIIDHFRHKVMCTAMVFTYSRFLVIISTNAMKAVVNTERAHFNAFDR